MIYELAEIPAPALFQEAYYDTLIYHDAVWLTAHNAFANIEDGWIYAQQSMNLKHAFEQGVRSFMLDVYKYEDQLVLCHGTCVSTKLQKFGKPLDSLESWFNDLNQLLGNVSNQHEIITLHLESYAPSNEISSLLHKTGLINYILSSANPNDDELTLSKMRKNNERLVIFSDYAYERKETSYSGGKSGMHLGIYPTSNYKETQYSIDDYSLCEMRTDFRANPHDPDVKLFVFNHFSKVSTLKDYSVINRYDAIMSRISACISNKLFPNFVTVDYFEQGKCDKCLSTKAVVFTLNKLSFAIKSSTLSENTDATLVTNPTYTYSHLNSFYEYFVTKIVMAFTSGCLIGGGGVLAYQYIRKLRVGRLALSEHHDHAV